MEPLGLFFPRGVCPYECEAAGELEVRVGDRLNGAAGLSGMLVLRREHAGMPADVHQGRRWPVWSENDSDSNLWFLEGRDCGAPLNRIRVAQTLERSRRRY